MATEFEKVYVEDIPLEHIRDVVSALVEHLGLVLERRWPGYGEPDQFRFIAK